MRFPIKIIILSFIFYFQTVSASAEDVLPSGQTLKNGGGGYCFAEGKINRFSPSGEVVETLGDILAFSASGNDAWFIEKDGETINAGLVKNGVVKRFQIPAAEPFDSISRFRIYRDKFYYLVPGVSDDSCDGGLLMRFDPDRGILQSVSGVLDFNIIEGRSVILRKGILDYNGVIIPLADQESRSIGSIVSNRIVFVRGPEKTEICDLVAGGNIYQYGQEAALKPGNDYNMLIEFIDEYPEDGGSSVDEAMIYYRIVVNGAEEGRTETGPPSVYKRIYLKGISDNYNIISMERWELNRIKGKYERLNNIKQPETVRIYLPAGRLLKINVGMNNGVYRVQKNVLGIRKEVR